MLTILTVVVIFYLLQWKHDKDYSKMIEGEIHSARKFRSEIDNLPRYEDYLIKAYHEKTLLQKTRQGLTKGV